jgi:sulfate permease, SulP family
MVKNDIIAGITVAIVGLPLAIGFGVTSGLSATAGIATAIVAGFLAAVTLSVDLIWGIASGIVLYFLAKIVKLAP